VLEELENDAEESLIGQKAADRFYQYFFASMKSKLKYPIEDEYRNQLYLADLLANENPFAKDKKSRQTLLMQPFKTAAQKFTVFDSNTIDVLVPFQEGKHIIDKLRKLDGKKKFCLKEMDAILKEAKLYTISIFETQKKQLDQYGYLEQLLDGRVLVLNEHAYHDEYGLKRMQEPGVEEFIF
jgi:CRISPR-associated endonuclease/helicase Cas3